MWRPRPVFISSTFTDMQAERDHLRTHVFPELEERLRKRRHYLEWVDLRMGVAVASLAEGEAREDYLALEDFENREFFMGNSVRGLVRARLT